ncbi:hypothetical protein [Bartonella elizabethae]|nr:hypothetical protein [Bartonella elizabethae]
MITIEIGGVIQSRESTHDKEVITTKNVHHLAIVLGIRYRRYEGI